LPILTTDFAQFIQTSHLHLSLPSGLFPAGFRLKFGMHILSSHACYVPAHLIILDLIDFRLFNDIFSTCCAMNYRMVSSKCECFGKDLEECSSICLRYWGKPRTSVPTAGLRP